MHLTRRNGLFETRRPPNGSEKKPNREQFRDQQRLSAREPANEERESNWNECDRPNDDDRMPDLLAREFETENYRGRDNSKETNQPNRDCQHWARDIFALRER